MDADYKKHLDEITKALEDQRQEKDAEIKRLNDDLENLRANLEQKINDLELTLEKYQQMSVKLESEVLEANTKLAALEDIAEQLEMMKAHKDSMEASKQEL